MAKKSVDYYAVLGVARDAPREVLRKAYRKIAVETHPDRDKSEKATERFKEAAEAYAVLSDADKRAAYDKQPAVVVEVEDFSERSQWFASQVSFFQKYPDNAISKVLALAAGDADAADKVTSVKAFAHKNEKNVLVELGFGSRTHELQKSRQVAKASLIALQAELRSSDSEATLKFIINEATSRELVRALDVKLHERSTDITFNHIDHYPPYALKTAMAMAKIDDIRVRDDVRYRAHLASAMHQLPCWEIAFPEGSERRYPALRIEKLNLPEGFIRGKTTDMTAIEYTRSVMATIAGSLASRSVSIGRTATEQMGFGPEDAKKVFIMDNHFYYNRLLACGAVPQSIAAQADLGPAPKYNPANNPTQPEELKEGPKGQREL